MSSLIVIKSRGIRFPLLLAWFVVVAPSQPAEREQAKHERRLDCLGPRPGENLEHLIQADRITCREKNGGSVSITVADVTEIAYDLTSLRPKAATETEIPAYAANIFGVFMWTAAVVGTSASDAIQQRPHHYVFIYWSNESENGTAVYLLKKKQMVPTFCARLTQVTGRELTNWLRISEAAHREH